MKLWGVLIKMFNILCHVDSLLFIGYRLLLMSLGTFVNETVENLADTFCISPLIIPDEVFLSVGISPARIPGRFGDAEPSPNA